jgi:branched-chain amino acid transport system permease protein
MSLNFRSLTIALLVLALVAPHFVYPIFLMKVLCYALFACSFNLLLGYGGLMSFGHAAFFGSAGYITAHAVKHWGVSPELGILSGVAIATILGAAFGWLAIRRQGIYFAMITLALAQLIYFVALQAPFTGGEDGIQAVPRGHLFGVLDLDVMMNMYYVVVAIFTFGFLAVYRIINSPFGQVLKGIRENEARAISLGYRANRYKHVAFILSAALAGLAGSTKVLIFQLASLADVHWTMSGSVAFMTMVGGLGTLFGPLVGALIVAAMENYLAESGSRVLIIEGVVFIICVLTFRRGIVGEIDALLERHNRPAALKKNSTNSAAGPAVAQNMAQPPIE